MSLTKAYSKLRNHGHKMAGGGMCEACGGACKYSDGGEVGHNLSSAATSDAPKAGDQPDAKKRFSSMFGPPQAEADEPPKYSKGGMIKGVHEEEHHGQSLAGAHLREIEHDEDMGPLAQEASKSIAKKEHHKVLSELKLMKNPKLKGLYRGGSVEGVHRTEDEEDMGESGMGSVVRSANEYSEHHGNERGSQQKHESILHKAKAKHHEVLGELKNINPKLKGLAHGGEVEASNEDQELIKMIEQELKEAIKNKDEQAALDMIHAILDMKG